MKYSADVEQKIKAVAKAASEISGLKVIATGLYGSVMRGYADPTSDIDVTLLVERPLSDYMNITSNQYFKGTAQERRAVFIEFSSKVSKQSGVRTMVSLVDVKELLVGIITNNPFSLCAYEHFSASNPDIIDIFQYPVRRYEYTSNKINRMGSSIRKNLTDYGMQANSNDSHTAFRKERAYLSILWHSHRLLAYVSGDRVNSRTMAELLEINRPVWAEQCPELFSSLVVGIYKARINRNHFDSPSGVSTEASAALITGTNRMLAIASDYIKSNPIISLDSADHAYELLELYNALAEKAEAKEVKEMPQLAAA